MRGGERQPYPRQAPEACDDLGRGLVVAQEAQRRPGRDERCGPQDEVEADHEAVLQPQKALEIHCGGSLPPQARDHGSRSSCEVKGLAARRLVGSVDRLYARQRARWIDGFATSYMAMTVLLCALADVTFALYVPMSVPQFALLFVVDEILITAALGWGTVCFLRETQPIRSWLARPAGHDGAVEAWVTTVKLPRRALEIAWWRAVFLAGVPATVLVAVEFSFPATTVALFFIGLLGAAIYPTLLFYFGLELYLRPLLSDIGGHLPPGFAPEKAGVSLRRKVMIALPLMNVISGGFVGVLATLATGGSLVDLGLYVMF